MTFDWHMLYPLHTVILDNSQVFGGVPCKAQLCNFSKWFFSPRFGVVPIWELWQLCYVRIEPPKSQRRCPKGTGGHVPRAAARGPPTLTTNWVGCNTLGGRGTTAPVPCHSGNSASLGPLYSYYTSQVCVLPSPSKHNARCGDTPAHLVVVAAPHNPTTDFAFARAPTPPTDAPVHPPVRR